GAVLMNAEGIRVERECARTGSKAGASLHIAAADVANGWTEDGPSTSSAILELHDARVVHVGAVTSARANAILRHAGVAPDQRRTIVRIGAREGRFARAVAMLGRPRHRRLRPSLFGWASGRDPRGHRQRVVARGCRHGGPLWGSSERRGVYHSHVHRPSFSVD